MNFKKYYISHFLIFAIFLLMPEFLQGQVKTIIGQVVDGTTEEPLSGVKIHPKGFKFTESNGTTSNEKGYFVIEVDTSVQFLTFEKLGMATLDFPLAEAYYNECFAVMEPEGNTSVTASRWKQPVDEVPASTVVITRDEIEANGYLTLQEILENVPGLYLIDHRSETGVSIGIRGFWSDFNKSVMIQLNGVNMLSERRNDFPLFKINISVESIDKIEIVRGPMSVIYGAGAFFGVINIITNDGLTADRNIVSSGIGYPFTQRNFFRYSTNNEGFNISLNATTYQRVGFKENWDDMVSDAKYLSDSLGSPASYPNAVTIHDYKGKAINPDRYARNSQSLNLSVKYRNFFANTHMTSADFGFSFLQPGPGDRNSYKSFSGNFQGGYEGQFGSQLEYQIKTTYMRSFEDIEYKYYWDSSYVLGQNQSSALRNEFNTRWKKDNISGRKDRNLDVISGIYFNRCFLSNSLYNAPEFALRNWYTGLAPDSHVDTYAAYAQLDFKVDSSLQLIAGGRWEYESSYDMLNLTNGGFYDTITGAMLGLDPADNAPFFEKKLLETKPSNGSKFIPRIAAVYKLKNGPTKHVFKLMFGNAIKEPAVTQNAYDVMAKNDSYNLTNSYLKSERIYTVEVGYTLGKKLSSGNFEFNSNAFWNELNDLISREGADDNGKFKTISVNSDEIRTYGLEATGAYHIHWENNYGNRGRRKIGNSSQYRKQGQFIVSASATLLYTKYVSGELNGERVSFSPPVLATAQARLYHKLWKFGLTSNYVGPMKALYAFGEHKYYGEETKGYVRLSLNARIQVPMLSKNDFKWSWYANLKVDHLVGNQFHYPTYFNSKWSDLGILGRGRTIMLSLGYQF